MVPSEPQNLGPKLSKSLINTPPGINRPVPFGLRKEPDVCRRQASKYRPPASNPSATSGRSERCCCWIGCVGFAGSGRRLGPRPRWRCRRSTWETTRRCSYPICGRNDDLVAFDGSQRAFPRYHGWTTSRRSCPRDPACQRFAASLGAAGPVRHGQGIAHRNGGFGSISNTLLHRLQKYDRSHRAFAGLYTVSLYCIAEYTANAAAPANTRLNMNAPGENSWEAIDKRNNRNATNPSGKAKRPRSAFCGFLSRRVTSLSSSQCTPQVFATDTFSKCLFPHLGQV